MGTFKPLDELLQGDARWGDFVFLDNDGFRSRTLEERHAIISEISLGPQVPEAIRVQFDVARNLLLYAWFVYRFTPVAELHAYSTLEMALRERASREGLHTRVNKNGKTMPVMFRELAEISVDRGWVRDEGFESVRDRLEKSVEQREVYENMGVGLPLEPATQDAQRFSRILAESLPALRNNYAHGSKAVHPDGVRIMRICRDWINQLFS